MATQPVGLFSLHFKRNRCISSFFRRYSNIFNIKLHSSFGLSGIRFKSSKTTRNNHFGPSFGGNLDCSTRVSSDVDYTNFRENSQKLRKLRNDYFSRASQAYSNGQRGLANILSQKGRMMNIAIKHSEMKSSSRILKIVNSEYRNKMPSCSKTLNVHGLHVKEAVKAVQEFLYYNSDQKGRLKVITGWGKNSYPSEVRLLPALKRFLEEGGLYFKEVQPGVIEIIR